MAAVTGKQGIQRGLKLLPENATLNMRASQTFVPGALVAHRIGSNLAEGVDPDHPRADLIIVGCATHYAISGATVDGDGNALDEDGFPFTIMYEVGLLKFFDTGTSANQLTDNDRGKPAFGYDNNTLWKTDNNGSLSFAGIVHSVDASEGVRLMILPEGGGLAWILAANNGPDEPTALAVLTTLGANTGTGTDTITITATGALGAVADGLTPVLGDIVFIPEGTTNLGAAADGGPWEIANPGAVGVSPVLRRPAWWAHGAAMPLGAIVKVALGSVYGGSEWRTDAAKGSTIGTTAPAFWPKKLTVGFTFASGTLSPAITSLPVKSLTKSRVTVTPTPTVAPHANTRIWRASAVTVGALGTCSITPVAETAPGTTNASDVGTAVCTVEN